MKLVGIIIAGVIAVTFFWGVLVHVMDGNMTFSQYAVYYGKETTENFKFIGEIFHKQMQPMHRRGEAQY